MSKADNLGATASLICAVHCVALPVLLAALPVLGLAWLDNPWVDRGFFILAMFIILAAHPKGYRKHGSCVPASLAVFGLLGILLALAFEAHPVHHYAIALGGLFIACSHFLNRRFCEHHQCHTCCEGE